jgi:hypothetical protein
MLTAGVIVFSQLFYFQAATYCQEKAQTQQKEKESPVKNGTETSSHLAFISIPSNTITSVSTIQLGDGLSFVQEVLCEPQENQPVAEAPPLVNGFFYTLFRFIIASNAP